MLGCRKTVIVSPYVSFLFTLIFLLIEIHHQEIPDMLYMTYITNQVSTFSRSF